MKTGHAGVPKKWLNQFFDQASARGATKTLHLGDGTARFIAHAWNEPGFRPGKSKQKGPKIWIANCHSGAPVEPWAKKRHFLSSDGVVSSGTLNVPQSLLIRQYFRAANGIDMHNQLRQHFLGIERTWKTQSWHLCIFQTVMGIVLVNAYLAMKYFEDTELSLKAYTNKVCAVLGARAGDSDVAVAPASNTRGAATRTAHGGTLSDLLAPDTDHRHAVYSGRSYGLGGTNGEGRCKVEGCSNQHATMFCVTCSSDLLSTKPKAFWICSPGCSGRQCYRDHMLDAE
jgi:hypothetical protein